MEGTIDDTLVEYNCTSTWLVWAERDQTGVQYSAAE